MEHDSAFVERFVEVAGKETSRGIKLVEREEMLLDVQKMALLVKFETGP